MKKVYVDEWSTYTDVFERKITCEQAISMVKRLKKHFDIKPTFIAFDKYKNASASPYELKFPNTCKVSMGMVAHEVAHQFAYKKYGENMHHNKKYKKCMKMIINYVRKRNYWQEVYKDTTIDISYRKKTENWVNAYKVESSIKKEKRLERKTLNKLTTLDLDVE